MKKQKPAPAVASALFTPRLPLLLVLAVFAVWIFVVLKSYFSLNPFQAEMPGIYFSLENMPLSGGPGLVKALAHHLVSLLGAALLFGAFWGAGRGLLRWVKPRETTPLEDALIASLLGMGVVTLLLFVAGVSGFLYRGVVLGIIGALDVLGAVFLVADRKNRPSGDQKKAKGKLFSGIEYLWVLLMALMGSVILIGALSPETFYDSLVYHIARPNFWIQNHRIVPDAAQVVTDYYPGNSNLLFTAGIFFNDETVCKLISFFFALLTALLVYAMGKRFSGRRAGVLAAVLFLSVPYAGLISFRSGVEMLLAFFECFAAFGVLLWMLKQERRWLIVAAIACGLGIGTKYTSFYCMASIMAMIALDALLARRGWMATMKALLLFIGISIAVASPWFLYNLACTGNPLYPFLSKYLGHLHPREFAGGDPALRIASTTYWASNIVAVLKGPWTVTMGQQEEAFVGPALLLFAPLFLLLKSAWKGSSRLFVYVGVYWLIWGVIHGMYLRYYMPVIPVFCFLAAIYLHESTIPGYVRSLFGALLAVIIAGNVFSVMNLQKLSNNCLAVVAGRQTKAEYLNTMRMTYPNPYYGAAQWINEHLPQDSLIDTMGEERAYYIERKTIMSNFSNNVPVIVWSGEAADADALYATLREKGVTHFLVNVPELHRLTTLDVLHFEGKGLETFSRFWNKYVQLAYCDIADSEIAGEGIYSMKLQKPDWWKEYSGSPFNYVFVYRILSEEEAVRPHEVPYNFFLNSYLYPPERWKSLEPVAARLTGRH